MSSLFSCIECKREFPVGKKLSCDCGGLLEVRHSFPPIETEIFDNRLRSSRTTDRSGVWRYKELIHPSIKEAQIITRPEGNTNLYKSRLISDYVGLKNLQLKHEGENPTCSFKDRGMTVGVSEAKRLDANVVVCASTGNTSSSIASYAAQAGLKCIVFIPEGEISYGKFSQTVAYGAKVLQVKGNFDHAMDLVQKISDSLGFYLLNSINPWRIEGQKSIIFELVQQRGWTTPDWIVFPGGNLGNASAFGKAVVELKELGLIDNTPRLAIIQAQGANPFYKFWRNDEGRLNPTQPQTIASAIKIGNPINWKKADNALRSTRGLVEQVSDKEILDAKAIVDKSGIGCEPASAASVAGVKKLFENGIVDPKEDVVCILTGHLLKDSETSIKYHTGLIEIKPRFANPPITIEGDSQSVENALEELNVKSPRW